VMQKLNEVVPLLVSSPERDKYRTRLERLGETKTEVFLSHEGMAFIVSATSGSNDRRSGKPTWQYRPRDPNLESEMLYRMASAFGVNSENPELEDLVDDPKSISEEGQTVAQLKEDKGDYCLSISLPFERSWRRIGLILDSRGFSIEDKSREEGIFYIKYNDPDSKLKPKGLARLAFWRDRRNIVQSYRVVLTTPKNAELSELRVLDSDGEQLSDETALKILRVIQEQLI
jgi:outer membrane protein assembly factor BamC